MKFNYKHCLMLLLIFISKATFAPIMNYDVLEKIQTFSKPLEEKIILTQNFSQNHDGIDLISTKSRVVKSIISCKITKIDFTPSKTPFIQCENFYFTFRYLHIYSNYKVGDFIMQNQFIGYYNNEGNSDGYHIHIIMIKKNKNELVNPNHYIKI